MNDFINSGLSESFDYNEAQLNKYIEQLPTLPQFGRIVPISARYLAKGYRTRDARDPLRAATVASQLGVRAPEVRRVVYDNDGKGCYHIMDRISGNMLHDKWPELGWIASIRLARQMVHCFHSVRSTTAGSLETGECKSFWLEDTFEPPEHASIMQINAFLSFWANFRSLPSEIHKTQEEHMMCPEAIFKPEDEFVFTHHDLAPRNIIYGDEGKLWLIDWDYAGFYPKCFEHAAMHNFWPTGWARLDRWRWKLFSWLASGF